MFLEMAKQGSVKIYANVYNNKISKIDEAISLHMNESKDM